MKEEKWRSLPKWIIFGVVPTLVLIAIIGIYQNVKRATNNVQKESTELSQLNQAIKEIEEATEFFENIDQDALALDIFEKDIDLNKQSNSTNDSVADDMENDIDKLESLIKDEEIDDLFDDSFIDDLDSII